MVLIFYAGRCFVHNWMSMAAFYVLFRPDERVWLRPLNLAWVSQICGFPRPFDRLFFCAFVLRVCAWRFCWPSCCSWYVDGPSYVTYPLALRRMLSAWFAMLLHDVASRVCVSVDICALSRVHVLIMWTLPLDASWTTLQCLVLCLHFSEDFVMLVCVWVSWCVWCFPWCDCASHVRLCLVLRLCALLACDYVLGLIEQCSSVSAGVSSPLSGFFSSLLLHSLEAIHDVSFNWFFPNKLGLIV